ncbi:acetolactate synthase small subunit [Kitasatospora mediocidica]|uniref:acetolactate synthase small subunit n=1 Tax=Kitasatospora mediocidica TaxID=58352 RepID=UPI0005688619|nr:acetolactate synthase small subunit [Kitasatospora mediocidica]
MPQHTLAVLALDKPDVLTRTTALLARRGFAVESVAHATTQDPGVARLTIVLDGDDRQLDQAVRQLHRLVDVLEVVPLPSATAIRRELLLVKVRADDRTRAQIAEITRLFRARTVDVSPDAVTVEATGTGDKLAALLAMLAPYGISEQVRSGAIAITRGAGTITDRPLRTAAPAPLRATA